MTDFSIQVGNGSDGIQTTKDEGPASANPAFKPAGEIKKAAEGC